MQDVLFAKLLAPRNRLTVVNHDISVDNILNAVGAGRGVSLLCEAFIGAVYPGVVYRQARDGLGSTWISYTACWQKDNANPARARFLELLQERHPQALPSKARSLLPPSSRASKVPTQRMRCVQS